MADQVTVQRSGELMTPAQANAIREYEQSLERWGNEKRASALGFAKAVVATVLLFAIAYLASGYDGPVHRGDFLAYFAMACAAGGSVMGIVTGICMMYPTTNARPVRPVILEPLPPKERQSD